MTTALDALKSIIAAFDRPHYGDREALLDHLAEAIETARPVSNALPSRPAFQLELGDGYPCPFPVDLPEDEQEEINQDLRGTQITLKGVVHFEWRFSVTVEFIDHEAMREAQAVTGWQQWGAGAILEAPTSESDGREFPAVIVGDKAYCQIIMRAGA